MVGRARSKALLALEVIRGDDCSFSGPLSCCTYCSVSGCRHRRIRILNSTVPIDAVKCFFNPPRVPARVSVTVKSDFVPALIMPRLIGVSRNGLKFKFVKAVCPYRAHFPIIQGRPFQFQHQKYLWHVIVLREISQ